MTQPALSGRDRDGRPRSMTRAVDPVSADGGRLVIYGAQTGRRLEMLLAPPADRGDGFL